MTDDALNEFHTLLSSLVCEIRELRLTVRDLRDSVDRISEAMLPPPEPPKSRKPTKSGTATLFQSSAKPE